MSSSSPEFELMCLSARVDFSSAASQRAAALIRAGIQWHEFLAGVERNYIAPLVLRNLKSLDGKTLEGAEIPAKVLDTLRVRAKITAFKSEKFAAELVRLDDVFQQAGIDVIHYKGAVTAFELYGSVRLRNFNDLDFLVRRRDLRRVVEILEAQGYENSEKLTAEQFDHCVQEFKEFLFTRGDVSLEPHWSLAGRRYPFDTDYEGFWRRAATLQMHDTKLRVMSPEDALLVLCLVGAKGRWKRLQMVTDVAACIRCHAQLDWCKVEQMAADTGTLRILMLGALLGSELSGSILPPEFSARVAKNSVVRALANDVTAALAAPRRPPRFLPDSPAVFSGLLFRQRESVRHRWHYLWHTATTPEPIHLRRFPLPRAAFGLYRIVVPLHDFVMYPARQLSKVALSSMRRNAEPSPR